MAYRLFYSLIVVLCIFQYGKTDDADPPPDELQQIEKEEKKMSEYILTLLDHYKQENPVGLPGAPIPDPMDIPPLKQSFSIGTMHMVNQKLHGLKYFKITHVKVDLTAMRVEAALHIDRLDVFGNYTLSTWLSRQQGPFSVKLTGVTVTANSTLEVNREGLLEAQEMQTDMVLSNIDMNFENLGGFAGLIQSVMNSMGPTVFNSIKPFVLGEASQNIRKDVNKEVKKFPQKFPNSISPFDQLIGEVRKKVRNAGLDPYKVNPYNNSVGVFDIEMTHTWVYGLSSFHRTKDIIFEMRNNTVHALLQVGTQKLEGTSNWEISLIAGMMSRTGSVRFTVDYFRVTIALSQTMDTRNSPNLDDIQIELGNIQIRFDGLGTIDYVIEFAVNVIPNLLRYQLMDAIENPIKMRIQQELKKVNIERLVKDYSEKIDKQNLTNINFL